MERFWEDKTLAELDATEWESLCDGCGRCCLLKLEDADSGEIAYTGIACRLLDIRRCRCRDYQHRERYSPVEMIRSVFGLTVRRVSFEGTGAAGAYRYYGHKGFDYRDLAREIAERFSIRQQLFSPMPWLGPVLNSQAWFVCLARESIQD